MMTDDDFNELAKTMQDVPDLKKILGALGPEQTTQLCKLAVAFIAHGGTMSEWDEILHSVYWKSDYFWVENGGRTDAERYAQAMAEKRSRG